MESIDAIFTQKLSNELKKLEHENTFDNNDIYMLKNINNYNDTPLTLSNNNSDSNSDTDNDENISNHLSFSEGTQSIQELINNRICISHTKQFYEDNKPNIYNQNNIPISGSQSGEKDVNNSSIVLQIDIENETDILMTYFKCQKNIYEQSAYILHSKSTILHCIALCNLIGISICISFIKSNETTIITVIISNMTIVICIMLSIYLKPESKSMLYYYISKQFDYISESLVYLIEQNKHSNNYRQRSIIVQDIEKKYNNLLQELSNNLPYEIQKIYPISCNIGIFTFIKKINNRKQFLLNEIKKTKLEINFIMRNYENDSIKQMEKNRLHFLLTTKESLKTDLKYVKNAYNYMDEILTRENNYAETCKNNLIHIYFTKQKYYTINYSHCNSFVDEYLSFIIPKNL